MSRLDDLKSVLSEMDDSALREKILEIRRDRRVPKKSAKRVVPAKKAAARGSLVEMIKGLSEEERKVLLAKIGGEA